MTRRRLDTFCLRGERGIRVGYVHRRAALILTANRAYRLRGVRPGTRQRRVKRRLHLGTPIRIGAVRWYLVRLRRGEGVLKVRRGAVAEVGVVNRRLVPGPGRSRRFLRSFTAA